MGWISDAWNVLTGKPQSWYDRLDADQKALAVRAAEVNALGQEPWDSVREAYLAQTEGPAIDFLSFQDINDGITSRVRSLLVTNGHTPSDTEISDAEAFNAQYGRYVDYVKQTLPELAAQADADAAAVRGMLSQGSMKSPAAAGQEAFQEELERRAKILGAGVGSAALLYFGVPVLILMLLGRGKG